ncbi:MAG: hypothetical protein PVG55_02030 [Nitrospirota bacterium]
MRFPTVRIIFLSLYAVGMAYVEAMVVVYLRRLLPPEAELGGITLGELTGLLKDRAVYFEEQTREAATIVMLVAVAVLSAKPWRERAAAFLWCFALWDIFYYVFLRVWLGWPRTMMDMDVLFLIPGPWVAPVLLPVAASACMATLALVLFARRH